MYKYKKWLILAAAIFTLLALFYWQTDRDKQEEIQLSVMEQQQGEAQAEEDEKNEIAAAIVVDIKGAVKQQGVYELASGTRVKEAIEQAGGLLPEADTSSINLAQLAHDQMMIVVPIQGAQPAANTGEAAQNKISINIATQEELEQITGIGPKKAESILRYREEHGSFRKLEDLLEIEGIGEKSLEKIQDEIVVP